MLATGRKEELFCAADRTFESTKKIQMQWLTYLFKSSTRFN